MWDIEKLYKKIFCIYKKGDLFIAHIENKNLFPLEIPLTKVKESQIQKDYTKVLAG